MRRVRFDRAEQRGRLKRATYLLLGLFVAINVVTQIFLRVMIASMGHGPMSFAPVVQVFVTALPIMTAVLAAASIVKMWAPFVFEGIVDRPAARERR